LTYIYKTTPQSSLIITNESPSFPLKIISTPALLIASSSPLPAPRSFFICLFIYASLDRRTRHRRHIIGSRSHSYSSSLIPGMPMHADTRSICRGRRARTGPVAQDLVLITRTVSPLRPLFETRLAAWPLEWRIVVSPCVFPP